MLSTMTKVLPVQFISSWNEGDVETPAKLNLETGEVFDIEKSNDGEDYETLNAEYIATQSGAWLPVTSGADDVYRLANGDDLASIRNQFVYLS